MSDHVKCIRMTGCAWRARSGKLANPDNNKKEIIWLQCIVLLKSKSYRVNEIKC